MPRITEVVSAAEFCGHILPRVTVKYGFPYGSDVHRTRPASVFNEGMKEAL